MTAKTKKRPSSESVRVETPAGLAGWSIPALLIALHIILCALYNLYTPFGNNGYTNTPDEGAHFQYVRYVAENWRLPVFQGYEGVGYESHQPPLYYFAAATLDRLFVNASEPGKWVRLFSTLCSAWTVFLTWWIARRLRPENHAWAVGAMTFVAFLPMFVAIGSTVGNDALIVLIFTASLAAILRWMEQPTTKNALLIGVCIGLGLLTKTTAVLLLPIVVFAVYLKGQGSRVKDQDTTAQHPIPNAQYLRSGALMLIFALLIGGWWFARNAIIYKDPLLQKMFTQAFVGTAKASDFYSVGYSGSDYLTLVGGWTFRSFWFAYGTPETANTGKPNFLPDWIYLVLGIWQFIVLVGLRLGFRQPLSTLAQAWLKVAALTFALVTMTFLAFITVFFQAQGRYFLPALVPIALFNTLGWEGLFPSRLRAGAHLVLAAAWLAFAVGVLGLVLV